MSIIVKVENITFIFAVLCKTLKQTMIVLAAMVSHAGDEQREATNQLIQL
jgi:hypothetical protein